MPTATPTAIKGMTAVSKDSDIKPLGYICWFSCPDQDVSLRRLRNQWRVAGLDPRPLPKDLKAVNAFKRAVRDQDGIRTDPVTGIITETDVRPVLENTEDVVYQLSHVTHDKDNRLVEYPKALTAWYSKVTGDLGFKRLPDVPRQVVLQTMTEIQEAFDAASKTVTGAKVRTLVRQYIKETSDEKSDTVGCSGENLRGKAGGVYFVLARHAESLEALGEFLNALYEPHGRAYLYTVPLADGASEREMIRRHHAANCLSDMEDAMAEVTALLREGRQREVRSDVAQHHWQKLQRFKLRAEQYASALEAEQDEIDAHMSALQRQLKKLV